MCVYFRVQIWMTISTRDKRLQFEAIVDLGVDHWCLILSWAGRQAALDGRDSARIGNFGQRASICPEENPVEGSELMPLVRVLVLSPSPVDTLTIRCYL